jgi:hypothetical protein
MPPDLKPPIFLLGNVRSGTTMMFLFFDAHPALAGWYEPRTVWTYADPSRRHDRFDASDASPRVIRYIRERFRKYQEQHGGRRVMEKTPSNVLRIPYVRAIFPECRYLYMVREPLANLSSSELKWQVSLNRVQFWKRLRETPKSQLHHYAGRLARDKVRKLLGKKHVSVWGVRYPGIYDDLRRMTVEEVIAKQWVKCCEYAEKDLAALDPALVLRVRYEEFVADPVAQFERIARHFDLDLPSALAQHIRETVDPERQTKWRRLDVEVLRRCVPIVRDEMGRQGYALPAELQEMLAAT